MLVKWAGFGSFELTLGLRGFCCARFKEHRPRTRQSTRQKIDRGGTTFWNLLTASLMRIAMSIAPAPPLTGKRYRHQAAKQDRCQLPLPSTIIHLLLPG